VAVEGGLAVANDVTPELNIGLQDGLNKMLAEMVSLILLLPTVPHEHCKVNIVGTSTNGKLGKFLPHSFECDLICSQFV
jgi:hypothetical protein